MKQDKKRLREQVKSSLQSISTLQKLKQDDLLFLQIQQALEKQKITSIHCYLSTKREFNTRPLIEYCWLKNIDVFVPRIEKGRSLSHWVLNPYTKTKAGPLGILEPHDSQPMSKVPDVIFTPGLAFSESGDRLGYGGGYYDQFLVNYPKIEKWAVCYQEALLEYIPHENHDIKVDRVFTIK